jgi:hypothetical protein
MLNKKTGNTKTAAYEMPLTVIKDQLFKQVAQFAVEKTEVMLETVMD